MDSLLDEAQPYLLVTTALEETWCNGKRILFLGDWCKKYERRHLLDALAYQTIEFHWDDRNKFAQDYIYLENLHKLLLDALTEALNKFHGTNQTQRYWQILLDPWLFSYIAVVFDRWESLRQAFSRHEKLQTIFIDIKNVESTPYSYEDFVDFSAFSDEWNQFLYQKIIKHQYIDNCTCAELQTNFEAPKAGLSKSYKIKLHDGLIRVFNAFLGNIFNKDRVIFIGASFRLFSLAAILFKLKQIPSIDPLIKYRPTQNNERHPRVKKDVEKRSLMRIDFQGESDFEIFLVDSLVNDLPICLVEDFQFLREKVSAISLCPTLIITGSSHFGDYFAKMWIAENVTRGVKLIILEHGGSLPPFKELFNFEVDISDSRISWFLPHHPKHIQMPPPKLLTIIPKSVRNFVRFIQLKHYCTIVGNECPRWVLRAHFYPMANQWSTSFEMVKTLYKLLDSGVKDSVRIKPYPYSQGWNTHDRYGDFFGFHKLLRSKSLNSAFMQSRLIICSYPETTFSEAMASGVPTVLIYPKHLYELNEIALPLLEILKSAKIVFDDPKDIANHINMIWDDPSVWWNSPTVKHARSEFYSQAIDIESGWMRKWTIFLHSLVA